jgi:hypothetical protein
LDIFPALRSIFLFEHFSQEVLVYCTEIKFLQIPLSALSKASVCGRSLAGIAGSKIAGAWMSVSCECCVLSGRGLCDGPIPRAREFYRVWCVWVLSWSFDKEVALVQYGLLRYKKKIKFLHWQFVCAWMTGFQKLSPRVPIVTVVDLYGYIAGQCPLLGVFLL